MLTLVSCGWPHPPPFGSYVGGYYGRPLTGKHVTFGCRYGFRINGSATIVCQDDGTWNPSVPTCEPGNFDLNY